WPSIGGLVAAGCFAGLTACLELPALALLVALAVAVMWRSPLRGLWFVIPAVLLLAPEFVVNKLVIGTWVTYAKRGSPWYEYAGSHWLPPPAGEVKHGIDWARQ